MDKERKNETILCNPRYGQAPDRQGHGRAPVIEEVLQKGTLVIIAGTTNGYVAQEILGSLEQAEGFTRMGFRRGLTTAPGAKAAKAEFPGDVVIVDGEWQKGKTILDVADDLKEGDIVLKGANAFDPRGQPAVQIGNPQGGTMCSCKTYRLK